MKLREYLENDIDLGDIVFAPNRKDLPEKDKKEENTEIEEKLFEIFVSYIIYNKQLDLGNVQYLRSLMHDPKYSNYFAEPNESMEIYRGLGDLTPKILSNWIGIPPEEIPDRGSCEFKGLFRHRKGYVMSFSSSQQRAELFSMSYFKENYSVMIYVNVAENPGTFIDFSKGIYKTAPFDDMIAEKEILALKPVKVSKISWKKGSL